MRQRKEIKDTYINVRIKPSLKDDLYKLIYDKHDNPNSEWDSFSQVVEAMLYAGLEAREREATARGRLADMRPKEIAKHLKARLKDQDSKNQIAAFIADINLED